MSSNTQIDVNLRPWSQDDLPLLQRLRGDPAMNVHLGGPEAPEKIRERQKRYYKSSQTGDKSMFVIVVGPERVPAGSIEYWEHNWQGEIVWETGWSVLPENGIHAPGGSGLQIPSGSHHALQRLVIGSV